MTFISSFMSVFEEMEPPANITRWAGLSAVSVMLGRNFYFRHGTSVINPNMYVMFLGSSGTRKSTPIKYAKKVLKLAGIEHIAAERTSKEKFIMDLAGVIEGEESRIVKDLNSFLNSTGNITESSSPAECFIAADEANDFLGQGNLEFLSLLGSLWDFDGWYEQKFKNSKAVKVWNPTINMLTGNTPAGFAAAFPPEALGQGFFSRLLLIHAEPSGRKIAFPPPVSEETTLSLAKDLLELKMQITGEAQLTTEAKKLVDHIYQNYPKVADVRFDSYATRRLTHLIKLCLVVAAYNGAINITEEHIYEANTILAAAEFYMPKAMGEFGKAKNSDVSHKIITHLEMAEFPVSPEELWQQVSSDLDSMKGLVEIMQKLISAGKVIKIQEGPHVGKLLPKRSYRDLSKLPGVDLSYLTPEEKRNFT